MNQQISEPVTLGERAKALEFGVRIAARGRIGLVLGGGGAKGAYQIGCWKALRESGITRFDAIAGTSVGALNAVLVAQDDYAKAETIWHDMSFGRVLRWRWHAVLALAIRIALCPVYLGKLVFPARAIPVALWRAVREARMNFRRDGDPRHWLVAALHYYRDVLATPRATDIISHIVTATIVLLLGASLWWMLAAPLLTLVALILVAPLFAFLLVVYSAQAVQALNLLATRFVLATNEPLYQLLLQCVDVARLGSSSAPLFVTLASLREVTHRHSVNTAAVAATVPPPHPARSTSWWKTHVTGDGHSLDFGTDLRGSTRLLSRSSVEYVPSHFDVRREEPARIHEMILQSAGLPEIFPAREFDGQVYVDGGIVDNEPVAALVECDSLSLILVLPLDATKDEAAVREDLAANLRRLGRSPPAAPPRLLVLTPSRRLGNFLTGTLGFRASRCRALMRLGHCDTIRKLAQCAADPRWMPNRGATEAA